MVSLSLWALSTTDERAVHPPKERHSGHGWPLPSAGLQPELLPGGGQKARSTGTESRMTWYTTEGPLVETGVGTDPHQKGLLTIAQVTGQKPAPSWDAGRAF